MSQCICDSCQPNYLQSCQIKPWFRTTTTGRVAWWCNG